MVDDISLKPDPAAKGSYYRRIEDIGRALEALGVPTGSLGADFVMYYFGCEKLAFGILGIAARQSAKHAYRTGARLKAAQVQKAAAQIGLSFPDPEIAALFADRSEQTLSPYGVSARVLRNNLVHDLGDTNAKTLVSKAPLFVPKMQAFLDTCTEPTLAHLKVTYRP